MYIAFYKKPATILDRVIMWTSRGQYSHVELILNEKETISSSGRDGGTRKKLVKDMNFNDSSKWDIFEIKNFYFTEYRLNYYIDKYNVGDIKHKDRNPNDGIDWGRYDFPSIIFYHIFRIPYKFNRHRFICTDFISQLLRYACRWVGEVNDDNLLKQFNELTKKGYKMTPVNLLVELASLGILGERIPNEDYMKYLLADNKKEGANNE